MSDRGTIDTIVGLGGAPKMRPRGEPRPQPSTTVEEFIAELESDGLKGLWTVEGRVDAPSTIRPHVWHGKTLRAHLDRAGELMRLSNSPVRRALVLWNPGARDHWDVTNTLTASVQMMKPGESVTAHRHIHSTMLFITHGSGAYTVVNGQRITLSAGDLVLAPNWYWHEHGNPSDGDIIWMTGLDRSLVKLFDAIFFEGYPGGGHQPVTSVDGGQTPIAPQPVGDSRFSSRLVWRWNDIWETLLRREQEGAISPYDDVIEVFRSPATGKQVTPTFGCAIQMLRPGVRTQTHRHTSSAVYHVFRGNGFSIVDGQRYDWSEGDYFALPHRAWHEHANASSSEPAILFSMTDEPALDALALLREEHWEKNGGHQEIDA
jgi:gentisate 1,2-dioxygenase